MVTSPLPVHLCSLENLTEKYSCLSQTFYLVIQFGSISCTVMKSSKYHSQFTMLFLLSCLSLIFFPY